MSYFLPIGNSDYGFVDIGPADQCYATTAAYADEARNHCAAVMLLNLLYVSYPGRIAYMNPAVVFQEIHFYMGDGPILYLARRANNLFTNTQLPARCVQTNRHFLEDAPDRLVQLANNELATGRPVALMVAASPLRWHWVLAIPDPTNTSHGFTIIDGWHADRFYRYTPDEGAHLMAIAAFHKR